MKYGHWDLKTPLPRPRKSKCQPGSRKPRVAKLKEEIRSLKILRGCADCGYNAHPEALDFDHLPGTVKEAGIANLVAQGRQAALWREIAKCEVVCANCHRVRTALRRLDRRGK